MIGKDKRELEAFHRLNQILQELRSEDGCPWDRAQTPITLKKHLIEEVYELIDAIDRDESTAIMEEAGDLYLVLGMIMTIFQEKQDHYLAEVLERLNDKLIRRHPHVFGDKKATSIEEGVKSWQSIKAQEVAEGKPAEQGASLSRVGRGLPPLEKSFALQKASQKVGFHWDTPADVLNKVDEELTELKEAIEEGHEIAHIKEELGDVLFVLSCLAGSLEIDISDALNYANNKFLRRYGAVEKILIADGLKPSAEYREQMEKAWQIVKKSE